jgi:predicted amidohydrolase YtcJ
MLFKRKQKETIIYTPDFLYTNKVLKEKYSIYIEDGKIVETGKREAIKEQFPLSKEIKLSGILYPAFIDSHLHLNEIALSLSSLNADKVNTFVELNNIIQSTDEDQIYFYNLNFNKISKNEWMRLFNLKKPIFIQSKDEHSVFVNNAILNKYAIELKEVPGGEIVKHNGKFIGILKDNAINNVASIKNRQARKDEVKKAISYLHSMGISGATNFDFQLYNILSELDREKELNLHIFQGIPCKELKTAISEKLKTGMGSKYLQIGPIKCFLDGSLGSQTLLMREPEFRKNFNGLLTMDPQEFSEVVKLANKNNLQVAAHAIGSEAVHIVLETYKQAEKAEMRNRIEHMQFIAKDDENLIENTDFIASMQPLHYTADRELLNKYFTNGYTHAYDWKFLIDKGKIVSFGSDAPVVTPSVLIGMDSAVKRTEKRISGIEAFLGYTENAAKANFYERKGGRIIRGMNADFVLLNKPIKTHINFSTTEVITTIIGGRILWTK